MDMYSDLVNNLKDIAVDSVIDSTLTAYKDNKILDKTFVWTAISQEKHSGQIAYIYFINKNMYRRSVPYNSLVEFCNNNYVSNLLVNDGKITLIGGSMYDLPDLNSTHNRYTEQDIYNKAFPYIERTQAKIYEDFRNKCLRGANMAEVQSNFSENLSSVKDTAKAVANIAQAGAVTAMTVAGSAAVKGVVTGATKIYKAVNKKELLKIQMDIYKQLNTCHNMIEGLISIKHTTNRQIRDNKNLTKYSNEIEIRNDRVGNLRGLINQYGLNGCIQKVESMVKQGLAKAEGHKILDEPIIDTNGRKAGTIKAYGESTTTRLNYLKQLHIQTGQLINENIQILESERQAEAERRYLEGQQPIIITDIEGQIENINIQLEDIRNKDIDVMVLDELEHTKSILASMDIESTVNYVELQLGQVLDETLRENFRNRVRTLASEINSINNKLSVLMNNLTIREHNKISIEVVELSREVERVITGLYGGEQFQIAYNNVRTKLSELKLRDKAGKHKTELENLEQRISKNESQIRDQMSKATRDATAVNNIKSKIDKVEMALNNKRSYKNAQNALEEVTNYTMNSYLSDIKNLELQKEWRAKVDQKKAEYNRLVKELSKEAETEKTNILKELCAEIQRIKNTDANSMTRTELETFVVDKTGFTDRINNLELSYSEKEAIETAFYELKSEYNSKYNKAETIIRYEENSIKGINEDITKIRAKINNMEDLLRSNRFDYLKNDIEDDINKLITSYHRGDIRDTSWIDSEIPILRQELADKIDELTQSGVIAI